MAIYNKLVANQAVFKVEKEVTIKGFDITQPGSTALTLALPFKQNDNVVLVPFSFRTSSSSAQGSTTPTHFQLIGLSSNNQYWNDVAKVQTTTDFEGNKISGLIQSSHEMSGYPTPPFSIKGTLDILLYSQDNNEYITQTAPIDFSAQTTPSGSYGSRLRLYIQKQTNDLIVALSFTPSEE